MRAIVPTILAVALLAPTVVARSSLLFGTEDLPELPDGAGDVQYDRLYTGPRDQGYGDLTAAWFEYENATDEILLTIRTADGRTLESAPTDWEIRCAVFGNLTTDGTVLRDMLFDWRRPRGGGDLEHSVLVGPDARNNVNTAPVYERLEHRFEADLGEPAYFRYWLPRIAILQLGDELAQPRGQCSERFNHPFGTLIQNMDYASSDAAYSFTELRPVRRPDGELIDPIEKLPPEESSQAAVPPAQERTPGLGAMLTLFAVVVGLAARGRRTH